MLVRRLQEDFEQLARTDGVRPVLVLDDAHDIRPEVLGVLRVLTNFDWDSRLVVSIVLGGQPPLETLLAKAACEDVAQRIAYYARLRLLSRDETASYLEHRCTIAGAHTLPFDRAAVDALFEMTRGNLRAIDRLALGGVRDARSSCPPSADLGVRDAPIQVSAMGRNPQSTKRVARIMRENGLQGRRRCRYRATTNSKHSVNVAPNLLARTFTASAPNKAWVTDVTAVFTGAGWLYLAAILDLFSRTVVGWATSSTNDTKLALTALEEAVRHRTPPAGLIHHSDRGSPYASHDYTDRLKQLGMQASMSRTGDCWDNAVAESFFASLKGEYLDHEWYPSLASARFAIADYIDNFYNPQRRHSTLGYLSPHEFELQAQIAVLAA